MLLRGGEVCTEIYYCAHGAFRMFFSTEKGLEFNKSFFVDDIFFSSYSSMLLSIPSHQSIEALEPRLRSYLRLHSGVSTNGNGAGKPWDVSLQKGCM